MAARAGGATEHTRAHYSIYTDNGGALPPFLSITAAALRFAKSSTLFVSRRTSRSIPPTQTDALVRREDVAHFSREDGAAKNNIHESEAPFRRSVAHRGERAGG